ncbi:DUF6384 family protein, partial [Pantanalinema rosaneae CENA516]|uniref:DUF6384 family protein n=1 Tax=Pantanalinema rosaneae TaxID=1620701 RepID=UPI003D6EAF7E
HQESVVARELGEADRDAAMMRRLREIYEGQGLAVDDRILREGIKALKEQRFAYERRGSGLGRFLATVWIRRRTLGVGLAALLVAIGLAIGWSAYQRGAAEREAAAAQIALTETLPRDLARAVEAALAEAKVTEARAAIEGLRADAEAALGRGDAAAARAGIGAVDALRARLVETYELRVVSRPDEASGVFRVPDANTRARNYYLIVEAVGPSGEALPLPIRNEETGRTETVRIFGLRVPEAVFEEVRRDKSDDGIIQRDVVGEKPRGALDPVYAIPVMGGMITQW